MYALGQITIKARLDIFRSTCSRLETLDHHHALFLLKNVFHIPKLLYLLRTSPCHSSPILRDFEDCMRSTLDSITNCRSDDSAFQQITLPIKFGGLGVTYIRINLPAYIAPCMKTTDILFIHYWQRRCFFIRRCAEVESSKALYIDARLLEPKSANVFQKSWDYPVAEIKLRMRIENAPDELTRGRLLEVSAPNAGAWLIAIIPISSLGL